MMIAISLVSIAIGIFVGYKIGYYRCKCQFKRELNVLKTWAAKQRKERS